MQWGTNAGVGVLHFIGKILNVPECEKGHIDLCSGKENLCKIQRVECERKGLAADSHLGDCVILGPNVLTILKVGMIAHAEVEVTGRASLVMGHKLLTGSVEKL